MLMWSFGRAQTKFQGSSSINPNPNTWGRSSQTGGCGMQVSIVAVVTVVLGLYLIVGYLDLEASLRASKKASQPEQARKQANQQAI